MTSFDGASRDRNVALTAYPSPAGRIGLFLAPVREGGKFATVLDRDQRLDRFPCGTDRSRLFHRPQSQCIIILDRDELARHVPVILVASLRTSFFLPDAVSTLADASL